MFSSTKNEKGGEGGEKYKGEKGDSPFPSLPIPLSLFPSFHLPFGRMPRRLRFYTLQTETKLRSLKTHKKERGQYPAILHEQA